jgi:hypothetical protein
MVVLRHFGARIPGAIRAARPQNGLNMGGVCRRNACLFWHAAVGFPSAIRCSAQEICGLSRTVSCVSDIDVKPFAGSITYRTASTLHGAAFTRQFNWLARAGTGGASRSSMVNKIRISGEQDRESNRVIWFLLEKTINFLSYLLDCRLVLVPIFIFSTRHIRALSEGQEVCVLGRKYKVLDKPKPVGIQTPAHHSATVLLYEIREIIRVDDSLLDSGCFHNPTLKPTVIDPLLDLVNSDVQSFCEAVWREPISPSLRAFPQTVQHGANGTRRTLHDFWDFFHWADFDQVKQPLLLRLRPRSPGAPLCYALLMQKPEAGIPRVSREGG